MISAKVDSVRWLGLNDVHVLDGSPQLAFLFEVELVTLALALDQHAEEREQELQVLFGWLQRERIDAKVARLLADIQITAAEDLGE